MAAGWSYLMQSVLISCIAMSCGQDDAVARMHSPYMPDHPGSIPYDNAATEGTQYVEYLKGTMPLILVVPHGGDEALDIIHDRTAGCFDGACVFKHDCGEIDAIRCPVDTSPDLNAQELAMKMRENIVNITGHAPYVVISKLTPAKVDVDLDKAKGTFGDVTAQSAWSAYHHAIHDAKMELGAGGGLLLDLRNHRHSLGRVELGYITAADDLNKNDFIAANSSIKSLASRRKTSFSNLIRGKMSLGGLMQTNGIPTIPSPNYPLPNSSPYSSDSYIIRVHGSRDDGAVDAILVSSADSFTSDDLIDSYAHTLSVSVHEFLKIYYDYKTTKSVSSTYKPKASVKLAIGFATFCGCAIVLGLIFVARSRLRKFRIYRYERFAEDV